MKFNRSILVAGLVCAGVAFAETPATTPEVIARQDLMKGMGGAMKTLGGMAKGEVTFDAAAAEAAKKVLIDNSAMIADKFTANVEDAGAEAKADVWANWDDFVAHAKALNDAAAKLDVTSAETIGASMGDAGGACKSCHMAYKM